VREKDVSTGSNVTAGSLGRIAQRARRQPDFLRQKRDRFLARKHWQARDRHGRVASSMNSSNSAFDARKTPNAIASFEFDIVPS
jgi:hypothetical protein